MFKNSFILITVIILLLGGVTASPAQIVYVSDKFKITLRTGPSTDNKIMNMLPSGKSLEIIESQGEWSHVRVRENGEMKEGWVLNRYLMTEVPCEKRAEALLREKNQLQDKLAPLEKDLEEKTVLARDLTARLKDTSAALEKAESQYESLKREYADFLALKEDYEASKTDLQRTREELESLTGKYNRVKSSDGQKWFAAGAGVLLCGLLLGLLFGRREKKRKSTYY